MANRRALKKPQESLVKSIQTIHPTTKRVVCGRFKTGMKLEFEWSGLELEEVCADPDLFEEYFCQSEPCPIRKNGRCKRHGAGGAHMISGKYSTKLSVLTPERIEELVKQNESHTDLNPELTMLSDKIGDAFIKTQQDYAPEATPALKKLIEKAEKYLIEEPNLEKLHDVIIKMKKHCDTFQEVRTAESDLERRIKLYSDVFNVEVKNRALTGEFISRRAHETQLLAIFSLIAPIISDSKEKNAVKIILQDFFARGPGDAIPEPGRYIKNSLPERSENSDEESSTNIIDAEYSSEDVF
jgi:hypothetical protein